MTKEDFARALAGLAQIADAWGDEGGTESLFITLCGSFGKVDIVNNGQVQGTEQGEGNAEELVNWLYGQIDWGRVE